MALRVKTNDPVVEETAPVEEPVEQATEVPEMPVANEEPTMLPMAGGTVAQDIARYLGPDAVCQNCIHFLSPDTCEIVAGIVEPQGRCSLFTQDDLGGDVMPETDTPPANIPTDAY